MHEMQVDELEVRLVHAGREYKIRARGCYVNIEMRQAFQQMQTYGAPAIYSNGHREMRLVLEWSDVNGQMTLESAKPAVGQQPFWPGEATP